MSAPFSYPSVATMSPSTDNETASGGHNASRPFQQRAGRGSVLIAVLALIALLSFIMIEFMEEAMTKIRYYGLFYNRDDLRTEAYSALETSLAVINEIREIDRGLYSPVQGWGAPLRYAQVPFDPTVDISVRVVDESGKIPLATASPLLLNILFEEMGIEFTVAQLLTDSLLDWTDTDDLTRLNGAEADRYEGYLSDEKK